MLKYDELLKKSIYAYQKDTIKVNPDSIYRISLDGHRYDEHSVNFEKFKNLQEIGIFCSVFNLNIKHYSQIPNIQSLSIHTFECEGYGPYAACEYFILEPNGLLKLTKLKYLELYIDNYRCPDHNYLLFPSKLFYSLNNLDTIKILSHMNERSWTNLFITLYPIIKSNFECVKKLDEEKSGIYYIFARKTYADSIKEDNYFIKKDKFNHKIIEGNLHNGKPDGKWFVYYENGTIKEEQNYINGIENGEWKMYYPDGQIPDIYEYNNYDTKKNKLTYVYKRNSLKEEITFENGEILSRNSYKPEVVKLNNLKYEYFSNDSIFYKKEITKKNKNNTTSHELINIKVSNLDSIQVLRVISSQKPDFSKFQNLRELIINGKMELDSTDFIKLKNLEALEVVICDIIWPYNFKSFPQIKRLNINGYIEYIPERIFDINTLGHGKINETEFDYVTSDINCHSLPLSLILYPNKHISFTSLSPLDYLYRYVLENDKVDMRTDSLRIDRTRDKVSYYLYNNEKEKYINVLTITLKNDKIDGEIKAFDIDGALIEKRRYLNGIEVGVWTAYRYEDIKLKIGKSEKFIGQKRIILFKWKFKNGKLVGFKDYYKPKKEKKHKVKKWGEM